MIENLLSEHDIALNIIAKGKRPALTKISVGLAQRAGITEKTILSGLLAREKVGSTALGKGIAVPHVLLNNLSHPVASLTRLSAPIDFDAPDDSQVDLLFALLWPRRDTQQFLPTLASVSRMFRSKFLREALREALFRHADVALEQAAGMRRSEGEALEREIRGRLDRIAELAEELAGRADDVQEHVRERLGKRAEALAQETGVRDEGRLLQEIVLAADRMDITEEIVRLRSHVDQFRASLDAAGPGQPVGRRLDFLLQELGREANTVGSKGSDAPIAHRVVELKTELERVREQVQNVE